LGPLQYLELVSATIFGLIVFSDLPNTTSFIGMGIIVTSGLYVLMREHALEKSRAQRADTP
jgi:S-adenosylmethionine uptake transporter